MDIVFRLQAVTVSEVLGWLPDSPNYSTVRAQLRVLEEKGYVRHLKQGLRYVYIPVIPLDVARRSALQNLVETFFDGSAEKVVAALNCRDSERSELGEARKRPAKQKQARSGCSNIQHGHPVGRKSAQSLLAAAVLAWFASAGCSARKPTLAAGPPFRLGAVYGRPVVFAPSVAEATPNSSAIHLQWDVHGPGASAQKDCLAEDGPFRVEFAAKRPNSLQIALPSAEGWIADMRGIVDPDGDAAAALYSLFAKLDELQQDGCFGEDRFAVRDLILQSLPMEPGEVLFSYYGYRSSRSGLDLKPGMRLKVERAYLKNAAQDEQGHGSDNQEGVSFVYFLVESGSDGKIRFRRAGDVRFNPTSLRKKFQSTALESELSALQPELQYRLVFFGLHVPTEQKLSASIIGASSASKLDKFDRELRLRPTEGCKYFAGKQDVTCVDFSGWVTVTPQFTVELNGKPKLVDCGTPVRDVVPDGALSSLTIQRKFMDSYRDVRFKPGDASVLSLALIDGDRLTWSKGAQ